MIKKQKIRWNFESLAISEVLRHRTLDWLLLGLYTCPLTDRGIIFDNVVICINLFYYHVLFYSRCKEYTHSSVKILHKTQVNSGETANFLDFNRTKSTFLGSFSGTHSKTA